MQSAIQKMKFNGMIPIMFRKFFVPLLALSLTFMLANCAPRLDKRGKALDPNDLKKINVGLHTQSDVRKIVGSPTLIDKFNPQTWYYIYRYTSTVAFLKPEEKKLQIVAVNFSKDGIVKDIKITGQKGSRDVSLVSRETPTRGRDAGYLEQIFGNFGRIHRDQ